jgi:hypothetical protein
MARAGAVALTAAAAVLLAGACGLQAWRTWLGRVNPAAAQRLGVATPEALSTLAAQQFADTSEAGHDRAAKADAGAALLAAPLDAPAVRVLALEAEGDGDTERAQTLMRLADQRSRRDAVTQMWLFADDLPRRNFADGFRHADAALRLDWRLGDLLFPAMISAAAVPAAATPLALRLETEPDWRRTFLAALAQRGPDPAAAARVFAVLATTDSPPTDAESSALIGRMVAAGDIAGAHAAWLRLLPTGARAPGVGVYDGDFAPVPGAAPFNWILQSDDGAIAQEGPAGDDRPALYVRSPPEATHTLASQMLLLPPGRWRLTGRVRVEPGQDGDLFAWRIACAGGSDLGETRVGATPTGWRTFAGEFDVPAGCPAQWLRLFGLAHEGFEPGEATWRGLAVQPIQGAAAARAARQAANAA